MFHPERKNISQKILDLKKEDRGSVLVNELYQDGVEDIREPLVKRKKSQRYF